MGLSSALGAGGGQGGLVDRDHIVARSQVLERVVPIGIRHRRQRLLHTRRRRVGQRHGHASQRLVRARRHGTTVVVDVPEQGVTDRAVGDEAEVDALVVLALGERHGAVGAVGVLLGIARVARGRGVACGNREDNLVVLLARVRDDSINVRHQVRELVLAVGVRGHGLDGVAVQVDDRVSGTVRQGDGDASDAGLVRVLDAVLVRVEPHEVTHRGGLHEREVDLRGVGRGARQGDRGRRHERALAGLAALGRRTVAVGLLVVGQVYVGAVNLRLASNDLDLVRAHRQTGKGVVAVRVGRRGDVRAGRVLHRVTVSVEQTNRHAFERTVEGRRIVEPGCVLVVVDGARNGATDLEGSTGRVVRRIGILLIVVAQGRRVRNRLAFDPVGDLHQDIERLGATDAQVGVQDAGSHRLPVGGKFTKG